MKLSQEKKKDILLESFNVLKDNYSNNKIKIREIIGKMFSIDIDTSVEMWTYLLTKNKHFIKDADEAYGLTEGIIYVAEESIGTAKIGEIIVENEFLKKNIFSESVCVGLNTIGIIKHFLCINNLEIANELIDLVYKNKNNRKYSFGEYLEELIDSLKYEENLTDDAINILITWGEKVTDSEEKAKINVSLIDLSCE
ncbi:UNVERIFIED_CONTAM: hypothetical protein Cloal_1026 [Acetivibrio alkalicellulosi]